MEIGSNAWNVKAITTVLTVIGLTFVLVLSYTEGSSANSRIEIPQNNLATSVSVTANLNASAVCIAPPPPVQKISQVGVPAFTFVGGNTACKVMGPFSLGTPSLADLTLTLNAIRPLRISMAVDVNNNGTSMVPDGTTFTATYGTQTYAVYDDLHNVQAKWTVVNVPSGVSTFHFIASVPTPYKSGTYFFSIYVVASYDDNGAHRIWGNSFPVNLYAQ